MGKRGKEMEKAKKYKNTGCGCIASSFAIDNIVEGKECKECGQIVPRLTTDHIVPKWLFHRTKQNNLGIHVFIPEKENTRRICSSCNGTKGGNVDYKDPTTRKFLREFIKQLEERLDSSIVA